VGAPFDKVGDWSDDDAVHHLAVTWDDGLVKLYFDGEVVASGGESGGGPISLRLGGLRFGEDFPPTSLDNEPFRGIADDIVVLRRVASPDEIARMFRDGASAALASRAEESALLYTFDAVEEGSKLVENDVSPGETALRLPDGGSFAAEELVLNFATSAAGSIRVEIQDVDGKAVPGFSLEESVELLGDWIERPAAWRRGTDVSMLAGRPLRLRFVMRDADLYSLRFR